MSKTVNLMVLFMGVFVLVVVAEGLGAGCDLENCQGKDVTGGGTVTLACNANAVYDEAKGKCVKKPDYVGQVNNFSCGKSTSVSYEVNCDDCRCSYRNDDEHGAACKCRHKDTGGIGY